MSVPLVLVVAVAENGVIGADGDMPWHLPGDLKRFRALTMGKPIIMGRKTFESIGKPLPGRFSIVVTRDHEWSHEGVDVAASPDEAVEIARDVVQREGVDEICVIGGGEIYRALIGRAERLYVTHVEAKPEGDTRFPAIAGDVWEQTGCEQFDLSQSGSAATRFYTYQRRTDR